MSSPLLSSGGPRSELSRAVLIFGVLLSVALVLMAIIGAGTFYSIRQLDNTLSVTGSAKRLITSDRALWRTSISRTVTANTLPAGYRDMARDLASVKAFFKKEGIEEKDLDISALFMDEVYDYQNPNRDPANKQYTLRQTIELSSQDVAKVTELSKKASEVVNQGVIFTTQALEYTYSELPAMRISLLSEAVKDAKARAEKLAESNNQKVGSLKSAGVGVVQVLSPDSVEVSDYGTYDTSKVEKEVMVTVKATFVLR